MSISHTPHPWHLGHPGGPSGPFWSLINGKGNVVAMQIVSETDARLMRAAPDLYHALAAVARLLPDASLPGPVFLSIGEANRIRGAMSKAEGRDE